MEDCKTFRGECDDAPGRAGLSEAARAHAAACAACGEFERERASLGRLVGGLARVEAPADFEHRLRARMAASRGGGGGGSLSRFFFSPGLAWVAAAACFLAVSATLYFRQGREAPLAASNPGAPQVAVQSPGGGAGGANVERGLASSDGPPDEGVSRGVRGGVEGTAAAKANPKRAANNSRRVNFARAGSRPAASAVYSLTGASVRHRAGAEVATQKPIMIPVRTSHDSLRIVVRDERGTHRVPMRAVSFGSQELVAGVGSRKGAPAINKGGVW